MVELKAVTIVRRVFLNGLLNLMENISHRRFIDGGLLTGKTNQTPKK